MPRIIEKYRELALADCRSIALARTTIARDGPGNMAPKIHRNLQEIHRNIQGGILGASVTAGGHIFFVTPTFQLYYVADKVGSETLLGQAKDFGPLNIFVEHLNDMCAALHETDPIPLNLEFMSASGMTRNDLLVSDLPKISAMITALNQARDALKGENKTLDNPPTQRL